MIRINKGLEPTEWTAKKATPGFTVYEPIPELRDALLIEQGYICAYCMRRIPTKDLNENATSKIEHLLSQDNRPDLQLTYSNMAICCPGNLNDESHCDKLKGHQSVTFNLHSSALQDSINYSSKDGDIKSSNANWNNEIENMLNLNHGMLKQNRKNALSGVIEVLKVKGWTTASVKVQLKKWSTVDSEKKYRPFCGIVIWYLQKKVNHL